MGALLTSGHAEGAKKKRVNIHVPKQGRVPPVKRGNTQMATFYHIERSSRVSGACGGKSYLFFLMVATRSFALEGWVALVVLKKRSVTCTPARPSHHRVEFTSRRPGSALQTARLRCDYQNSGASRMGCPPKHATLLENRGEHLHTKAAQQWAVALSSILFVRTDNRIRSSVCARLGRIAAQVG
jgi:hypothetical protein